jgi:recombination protein RecA
MYGEGISKEGDILDLGSGEANVVEKSGAWFAWKGERIGQGRENAKEFLKANPDVAVQIERAVLEKHGIRRAGEESAAAAAPIAVEEPAAAPNGPSTKKSAKVPIDTPRA